MAKDVCADTRSFNADGQGRLSMIRSTPCRLSAPPRAFKNSRESFLASGKSRDHVFEIITQRHGQRSAHGHQTLFGTFAGHEDQLLIEIEVPRPIPTTSETRAPVP